MVVNGYKWIVINCLIAVFRFITHNAFSIILGTGQVMNAFFSKHRIQKRRPRWSESEKEIYWLQKWKRTTLSYLENFPNVCQRLTNVKFGMQLLVGFHSGINRLEYSISVFICSI